jgi:excisionase family DNA binding protein
MKDLLTTQEVAQILRVDGTTVRRWIRDGLLQAVALPSKGNRQVYRVRRASIETMIGGN